MRTGVYIIRNKIDNRIYIGSSIDIDKRVKRHKYDLNKGNHHSRYLQRFVNKYGIDSLVFKIKELCEIDIVLEREQFYIDTLKPDFNVNPLAQSCLGAKRTQEFKDRTSELTKGKNNPTFGLERTPEWKANISKANKGQKAWNKGKSNIYSQETIDKMKEASKGRTFSNTTRNKISDANSINVYQYKLDGTFIQEFSSIKEASLYIKGTPSAICANCKGKSKTVKGFLFRYEKKDKILVDLTHKSVISILQLNATTDEVIKEWKSAKEAAAQLKGNSSNINSAIKNNRTAYGYRWKYKD